MLNWGIRFRNANNISVDVVDHVQLLNWRICFAEELGWLRREEYIVKLTERRVVSLLPVEKGRPKW